MLEENPQSCTITGIRIIKRRKFLIALIKTYFIHRTHDLLVLWATSYFFLINWHSLPSMILMAVILVTSKYPNLIISLHPSHLLMRPWVQWVKLDTIVNVTNILSNCWCYHYHHCLGIPSNKEDNKKFALGRMDHSFTKLFFQLARSTTNWFELLQ